MIHDRIGESATKRLQGSRSGRRREFAAASAPRAGGPAGGPPGAATARGAGGARPTKLQSRSLAAETQQLVHKMRRPIIGAALLLASSARPGRAQTNPLSSVLPGAVAPVTEETAVDPTTGTTTYRLHLQLGPQVLNAYTIYGVPEHPASFPPAFQVATPFGQDIGASPQARAASDI